MNRLEISFKRTFSKPYATTYKIRNIYKHTYTIYIQDGVWLNFAV